MDITSASRCLAAPDFQISYERVYILLHCHLKKYPLSDKSPKITCNGLAIFYEMKFRIHQ